MPFPAHDTRPRPLAEATDELRADWRATSDPAERRAIEAMAAKVHMLLLVLG